MRSAQFTASLTGKTVELVTAERATGKTYGTIAKEAGKLDEFKAETLEQKKAILDQRVVDGNLTQVQADVIYNRLVTNQATCDGTGSAAIGKSMGAGFGQGKGMGLGKDQGMGQNAGTWWRRNGQKSRGEQLSKPWQYFSNNVKKLGVIIIVLGLFYTWTQRVIYNK